MPHHASRSLPQPADDGGEQAAPARSGLGVGSALRQTRFWRFCLVGGVGFVTDTSVLLALVHGVGIGPVPAKILSFGVAIVVTFQLNRLWAFGATRHGSLGRSFATYLWVQGTGAACNLAVFSVLAMRLPKPFDSLLLCAVVASAAALLVNYLGASRFVFSAVRSGPLRP